MEQKRVSFKVAKAIKDARYPQGDLNSGNCDVYPLEDHDINYNKYTRVGVLTTRYRCETWKTTRKIPYAVAPTYIDVWFWLWREKKIYLSPRVIQKDETIGEYTWLISPWDMGYIEKSSIYGFHDSDVRNPYEIMNDVADPEEAIIAAIEHLVDNGLLK